MTRADTLNSQVSHCRQYTGIEDLFVTEYRFRDQAPLRVVLQPAVNKLGKGKPRCAYILACFNLGNEPGQFQFSFFNGSLLSPGGGLDGLSFLNLPPSLLQAGLPTITGLGTQLSQAQKRELSKVGEFYICLDGDAAGRTAARELAGEFFPAAKVIGLPDGKDLNDLLQEMGTEKFKEFLSRFAAAKAKSHLA